MCIWVSFIESAAGNGFSAVSVHCISGAKLCKRSLKKIIGKNLLKGEIVMLKKMLLSVLAGCLLAGGGVCFAQGKTAQSFAQIKEAAEQGDPAAQVKLGIKYAAGKEVEMDYAEAAKWFRKAAEQGNSDGQCYLGILYSMGEGVKQNYEEAAKWLMKSAEQGNDRGQSCLALLYEQANGVDLDYKKAKELYGKSCKSGNQTACKSYERLKAAGY